MTSKNSEFKRACAEASLKMLAMVSRGYEGPEGYEATVGCVSLYDVKENRWDSNVHVFNCYEDTLYAGDGGLVCVVSTD